jgi:hypothetical protein
MFKSDAAEATHSRGFPCWSDLERSGEQGVHLPSGQRDNQEEPVKRRHYAQRRPTLALRSTDTVGKGCACA